MNGEDDNQDESDEDPWNLQEENSEDEIDYVKVSLEHANEAMFDKQQ
jgi:hypothetical protein